MSKNLVALAALSAIAFTTSVSAQSSVEIYGIVDVGYTSHKINDGTNNPAGTTKRSVIGSSGQSTSRLGFRGTEDLGGGTKAGFTFEMGLAPAGTPNGVANPTTTGANPLSTFDNRQAFVSLSSDKVGTLVLGRQYTPAHVVQTSYNAGGTNNVVGDVTYTQAEVGATAPTNGISGLRADALNTSAYLFRASNAAAYVLPNLVNGLTAAVAYVTVNTANNGTDSGRNGYTGLVKYDNGPLSIGGSLLSATAQSGNVATPADGVVDQGTVQNTDTKITNNTLGASYDLQVAKLFLTHITLKAETGANSSKRTSNKVGVNTTVGSWVPFVQYGTAENEDITAGNKITWDNTGYQLGTSYNFSKRTNAYAIYGKNKASWAGGSGNESQIAFGLRHQF